MSVTANPGGAHCGVSRRSLGAEAHRQGGVTDGLEKESPQRSLRKVLGVVQGWGGCPLQPEQQQAIENHRSERKANQNVPSKGMNTFVT